MRQHCHISIHGYKRKLARIIPKTDLSVAESLIEAGHLQIGIECLKETPEAQGFRYRGKTYE